MNNFEPGDRLFLFGFSRGAYTVRTLAALLRMYGLIRKGNEPLVPYAIRMLNAIPKKNGISSLRSDDALSPLTSPLKLAAQVTFEIADDFKATFTGEDCKPWFVGVWGTVSSVR